MGTIPELLRAVAHTRAPARMFSQMSLVTTFWSLTPRCYAWQNVAQSIPHNTYTSVELDSEVYDVRNDFDGYADDPHHSTSTDPSRVYVRTSGKYEVLGSAMFTVNATGVRSARIIKNGSTATEYAFGTDTAATANHTQISTTSVDIPLVAGDYLELQAFQNSGGALNLIVGQGKTFLRMKMTGS